LPHRAVTQAKALLWAAQGVASLPMRPGRGGTLTHDYRRNGTTDLFAAFNVGPVK
jgi:hypothetical protein